MKELLKRIALLITLFLSVVACNFEEKDIRLVEDFNFDWRFELGNHPEASKLVFQDSLWQKLNLPHDWNIETDFEEIDSSASKKTPSQIGWYRKTFTISEDWVDKSVSIEFDGVYRNSEVWINGKYLGKRPNGYAAFRYDLTDHLNFGEHQNSIAVKVYNPQQPNSQQYTGSGIYRNVRLVASAKLHVAHWGTYVTTPKITKESASVNYEVTVQNDSRLIKKFKLETKIYDARNNEVGKVTSLEKLFPNEILSKSSTVEVLDPKLWSLDHPYLYRIVTRIYEDSDLVDNYSTSFGIRYFNFDPIKGFLLNGEPKKIYGVVLQPDNGALGSVANKYALERKLNILKDMGANAIRTLNPPSSELLKLCDEMGMIVQVGTFDVWRNRKEANDYSENWDKWHKKDLEDVVKRDRNHPSVFMWNIGNEPIEQFNKSGVFITEQLVDIIKSVDASRMVTTALTIGDLNRNLIFKNGTLDIFGVNNNHEAFQFTPEKFEGRKIIASATIPVFATRGYYGVKQDSIQIMHPENKVQEPVKDVFLIPAFDEVSSYNSSSHENNWSNIKKLDFVAGIFVWSAFDYFGNPAPFEYPVRSSYSGILDMAGFPKDVFYMYQGEWSNKSVLHLFPHWNWGEGQEVDVWAYYNNADEVELFLNDESLGVKSKQNDDLHLCWQVKFQPGTLKAVSRKDGEVVLEKEIKTASEVSNIELIPNKEKMINNHYDLVYVTVNMLDSDANLVPNADNLIHFEIEGGGKIVGVDNGFQANTASFKAEKTKAFQGKCLVIIQSNGTDHDIRLTATTNDGIIKASLEIESVQE